MTAKIIHLEKYRNGTKHAGIAFPQVYRVNGFGWDFSDPTAQTGMVANTKWPIGPMYRLDDFDDGSMCNTTFEPVTRLDREDDRGWVVVRHHESDAILEGYMRGYMDLRITDFGENLGPVVYRTAVGLFTCINRPPNPGQPDRLLIYIGNGIAPSGPLAGMPVDTCKVIDRDGNELDDSIFVEIEDDDEDRET